MEELSDIDSIVQQTELSTNQEIPMESQPQETPVEVPQAPQEYEFQSEGRTYKGDIEKLKRWAQMGVTAPNKFGEFSKKISDYESRLKQYESYDKTYKPVDEWAKQNPDKWQSLLTTWQQAQFGQTPQQAQANQQAMNLPPEVIQKLQAHDQFIEGLQQKEVQQKEQAADQNLSGHIESIRKSYPNIDFDAPDESGNSLELRILKHATENGIPSFRAAFRDYCFDQLNQMSESKGREKTGISPKTKAGLLGKDPTPQRSRSTPDLKGRNYDQIHEMILGELGLSAG